MIEPQYVCSTKFQGPGQCVSNDGRSQVAHMHLLGNIWRGEIDHNPVAVESRRPHFDAIPEHVLNMGAHPLTGDFDIDETGSC